MVALNSVEFRHAGLASAINNSFSQITGLLAVAVLGVIMFSSFGAALLIEDKKKPEEQPDEPDAKGLVA